MREHCCWVVPCSDASNGGIPQGSVLGLVLFISDLGEATESTSVGFADDTNLGGPINRQQGRLEGQAIMDAVVIDGNGAVLPYISRGCDTKSTDLS